MRPQETRNDLHAQLLELVRSIGLLHVADVRPAGEVSLSELFALHELNEVEGLSQQDLATRLRLDKSTVSRLVASLESRDLLARERSASNRRVVQLSLTYRGRALHRQLSAGLHAHQQVVLGGMTPSERSALHIGLAGLLRSLHAAHAGHSPWAHSSE